jgi:hypothetical protein
MASMLHLHNGSFAIAAMQHVHDYLCKPMRSPDKLCQRRYIPRALAITPRCKIGRRLHGS